VTSRVYNNILDTIGNTPVVRLNRVCAGVEATVLAKLEMVNIGGSVKSRSAWGMVRGLMRAGRINKDTVLVEASTGNQGIAVAMVGAALGIKVIVCIPEHFGAERRRIAQLYGAEVILTPTYDDMRKTVWSGRQMALELEKDNPNYIYIRQFDNMDNPRIHSLTTAAEIARDVGQDLDAYVGTIGTGGTLSGIAKALKGILPNIHIVCVEPAGAAFEKEGKRGLHKQEGIGDAQKSKVLARECVDEYVAVTDEDAIGMARRLAREEGIFCGISSGTAVWAAIEVAKRLGKGKTVLTLLADIGDRYLQTVLAEGITEPIRRAPRQMPRYDTASPLIED
jgi:cysteine synthase A